MRYLIIIMLAPWVALALTSWCSRGSRGGVYVVRCRKPGAPFGLPFIGRHFGYVGETSSFAHRERQHNGKYLATDTFRTGPGKPWRDLNPRFYRIPLPFRWVRKLGETFLIWTLLPVYNVRKQPPYNFRKISLSAAQWQARVRSSEAFGWWLPRAVASVRAYQIVGFGAIVAGLYMGVIR
jgi:hypothetical protein